MKRLSILILILLTASGVWAQDEFAEFGTQLDSFTETFVNTLPLNTGIATNWADPYIGGLPHFGVGATVGVALVPADAVLPVMTALGVADSIPAEFKPFIEEYGIPIPAYVVDAKIGGIILPFDVGVKYGIIPEEQSGSLVEGLNLNYQLVGLNARMRLLGEDDGFFELSVGGSYNFMQGSVAMLGMVPGLDYAMDPTFAGATGITNVSVPKSDFVFEWQASTIDFTAQAAIHLDLKAIGFRPFAGVGAATAIANAGGGLESSGTIQYSDDNGTNYYDLTDAQIAQLEAETGQNFDLTSLGMNADITGWSFRAYGGIGIHIFMVNVDVAASYNLNTGALGAEAGLHLQF